MIAEQLLIDRMIEPVCLLEIGESCLSESMSALAGLLVILSSLT
jgi:hypothetical protein